MNGLAPGPLERHAYALTRLRQARAHTRARIHTNMHTWMDGSGCANPSVVVAFVTVTLVTPMRMRHTLQHTNRRHDTECDGHHQGSDQAHREPPQHRRLPVRSLVGHLHEELECDGRQQQQCDGQPRTGCERQAVAREFLDHFVKQGGDTEADCDADEGCEGGNDVDADDQAVGEAAQTQHGVVTQLLRDLVSQNGDGSHQADKPAHVPGDTDREAIDKIADQVAGQGRPPKRLHRPPVKLLLLTLLYYFPLLHLSLL
mmetsp:Transcript_46585/g.116009  ORF Transcript_46585/g.116009 Transcript_46585/m.116009 type:complete len:258 (-) Transcript_46585:534-1307(-)